MGWVKCLVSEATHHLIVLIILLRKKRHFVVYEVNLNIIDFKFANRVVISDAEQHMKQGRFVNIHTVYHTILSAGQCPGSDLRNKRHTRRITVLFLM